MRCRIVAFDDCVDRDVRIAVTSLLLVDWVQATKELRGGYTNLAQCMVGLVRNRGFGALYTGFLASIAVSAPSSAVFAAGYEFSKAWVEKASHDSALPLLQLAPVLAAAFGNVAASVVRVPPEIIKQRVQAGIYR